MARVWTCGFELQSTTTGHEFTTSGINGTTVIDTTHQRSGAACLSFVVAASFSWIRETFKTALSNSESFIRAYVNFSSLPGSGTPEVFSVMDMTGAALRAQIRYNGATGNLEATDSAGTVVGSVAVTTGVYYRIELDVAGGTGSGIIKAYLDGVNFASTTTATVGTFDGVYFGLALASGTISFYLDDVAINDTSGSFQTGLPGSGKVIILRPSAAGDVNTFATQTGGTAGAGNNFTRVNEKPPDDATTLNGSSTLNQEDLFNVDNGGLASIDTVNVVQVGVRFRNSTADPTGAFKVEIEKAAAGTISQSAAIVPNSVTFKSNSINTMVLPPITLYQDPDGAAWTNTTIDSMQIGYKQTVNPGTAGRRSDISAVWAYVDYTPGVVTIPARITFIRQAVNRAGTY